MWNNKSKNTDRKIQIMKRNINVKIAVGVNHIFKIVSPNETKDISLKNTNTIVNHKGYSYPLYTGSTPEDLQKINKILTKGGDNNGKQN